MPTNSVPASPETHISSPFERAIGLMLLTETIAVYTYTYIHELCGKCSFLRVKTGGTYSNHNVLNG
jgi:hypothetical protein